MKNGFDLQLSKEETDVPLDLFELKFALKLLGYAMEELKSDLKKVPLDEEALRIQFDEVMPHYLSGVTECYNRLGVLTQDERDKVKPIASGDLRALYDDLLDRVRSALDDFRASEPQNFRTYFPKCLGIRRAI